jgi:hypothetical protein
MYLPMYLFWERNMENNVLVGGNSIGAQNME